MRLYRREFVNPTAWQYHRDLLKSGYRVIDSLDRATSMIVFYKLGLVEEWIAIYPDSEMPKLYKRVIAQSSEKE